MIQQHLPTMETSKAHKLLLFKKENCAPCLNVALELDKVLTYHPEYSNHITVLQKENHAALVEAYKLEMYPTLIVLDHNLDELTRTVGQKNLTEKFFWKSLTALHNTNETSL